MATRKTSSRKASNRGESRTSPRGAMEGAEGKATRGNGERRRSADRGEDVRRARAGRGNGESRTTTEGSRRPRSSAGKNGRGRERAEREIEQTFGFVPSFYDAMPEAAFPHAWSLQRDVELSEGALDPKTKELIGLAVASHIKCRYCIYFHTQAALHHGATREQLHEAVAMGGLTVLFSNSITGAQVDIERFRREVDRALEHVAEMEASRAPSRPQISA